MGADFLLYSLPWTELDAARRQELHDIVDQLNDEQLQVVADAVCLLDQEDLPKARAAIHAAVCEYVELDGRRDTTSCRHGTDPYWRIYTGGLSWGDAPTECCQTFDIIVACDPLSELIELWAREDALKSPGDRNAVVSKYSPDIAGIMSCLCDALTDSAHGVDGCVIESSDNDNQDGEIFIETPDGNGGTAAYLIKVAPAR